MPNSAIAGSFGKSIFSSNPFSRNPYLHETSGKIENFRNQGQGEYSIPKERSNKRKKIYINYTSSQLKIWGKIFDNNMSDQELAYKIFKNSLISIKNIFLTP